MLVSDVLPVQSPSLVPCCSPLLPPDCRCLGRFLVDLTTPTTTTLGEHSRMGLRPAFDDIIERLIVRILPDIRSQTRIGLRCSDQSGEVL